MRITSGGYLKASNDGAYISAASPYHELVTNSANNASVIIGNKNASTPYGCYVLFTAASPNDATRWFYNAEDSTATRFTVRSNGGIANYQANDANLSDIRTKKDITPLESYWDKFKAIEIVKFKYKDQTHDDYNIGVIAQQVESVAPEFIDADGFGETPKDGIPLKTVYTADLHHATIKVLQEAMAKIEEQQAQIDELKQIVATK
jgi:S-layer protein (TIGR01564 family)